VGKHPLQLYSLGTPNGVKVTVMLEELLASLGHTGAEYDAWLIRINEGDQFGSGFVAANPNSKIPVYWWTTASPRRCVCSSPAPSCSTWPKSLGPSCPRPGRRAPNAWHGLTGSWAARHFWVEALGTSTRMHPSRSSTPIDRYAMEVKRQLEVLDRRLAEAPYLAGDNYTIADMAVWPWYGTLVKGQLYEAGEFLQVDSYKNVLRWTNEIAQRPAAKRGRMVNRAWGEPSSQLHERHDASDFELLTQDKLAR
jgi:GST-like protein